MSDTQSLHPLMTDLRRGLFGRCPCEGRAFLKVSDRCDVCGEELFHQRADDFSAYIVILILGHLLVPAAFFVDARFGPPYWVHLALWLPITLGLTVGLLQPLKGIIVASQWRMGMHGFEPMKRCGAREQGAEAA
jgi:uncharacterized protein (DUF983 family)